VISFLVNLAIAMIAAESIYEADDAENVGLTNFCTYSQSLKGACTLWGVAMLAAGQSSAIMTTYTRQYIMDGFLNLQLPIGLQAMVTQLVAFTPCVIVSVMFPDQLNNLINFVNALLSFLLSSALTPLVKYNCNEPIMGKFASTGIKKVVLYTFAIAVGAINVMALSFQGGSFSGHFVPDLPWSTKKLLYVLLQVTLQLFHVWWNFLTLFSPVNFLP
jgi:manganese transport protein